MKNLVWLAILAAVAAFFYIYGLARLPLEEADEATYAIVVREMVRNGNFLTMTYGGNVWAEKPPLLFWFMSGSTSVFGFNEFALRFPVAIFGILAVLFTAGILKSASGKNEVAFIGGIIMIFFPLFLAAARNVRMDVPVVAMIMGALLCFLKSKKNKAYAAGIGILTAVGFLLKSVVALLVLPVLLIYGFIYKDWQWLGSRYFWIGNAVGLIIALPWHIYEAIFLGNRFIAEYLGFHIAGRFAGNIIQSRITPAYIAEVFWKAGQPWSGVLIFAFAVFALAFFAGRKEERISQPLKFALFSIASAVFLTAIFMASGTKLITYFIPVYPFLVLFLSSIYWGFLEATLQNGILFLRGALVALVAVAATLSFKEAFLNSKLYVSRQVFDAKPIGAYLAHAPAEIPIFSYEYAYDKTVRYYSDRKIAGIKEKNQ